MKKIVLVPLGEYGQAKLITAQISIVRCKATNHDEIIEGVINHEYNPFEDIFFNYTIHSIVLLQEKYKKQAVVLTANELKILNRAMAEIAEPNRTYPQEYAEYYEPF